MLCSSDQSKNQAHPESGPPERQSAFSLEGSDAGDRGRPAPSIDAGPDSLPATYRRNRLWGIPRDPYAIFCYWQLALPLDCFPGARLAITVHRSDGTHESTTLLDRSAGTRFIDVSSPGTLYHLTLGFLPPGKLSREAMLFVIAQLTVRTPRDSPVTPAGGHPHGHGHGVLSSRCGHSPNVLALLFPNLALGSDADGSPSGAHPARTPRRRIPLPPACGDFLPPVT